MRIFPQNRLGWELIIALRLYLLVVIFFFPIFHIWIQLGYLPLLDICVLGFSILLLLRFVVLEPRTGSRKFQQISLILLLPLTCITWFNFSLGLILNVIHGQDGGILFHGIICGSSLCYFAISLWFRPFYALNSWFCSKLRNWNRTYFHRHPLLSSLICWLIISPSLLLTPFTIYQQPAPTISDTHHIGIWTTAYYFDVDSSAHLENTTLELMATNNIYVIITIKQKDIGLELIERLNRCKTFGLEVHLSIAAMNTSYKYVNIWTFETLKPQIETILAFLNNTHLLGNPVSTIVYDMETIPEAFYIIFTNATIREKLGSYYSILTQFIEFNRHIREDYHLNVRICTDYGQGFDWHDSDDDLIALRGLLHDPVASFSYMAYRRDNLGQNHILDHLKFLTSGDTIILNAWKFEGYLCWNDLACAIEDARLVLGYSEKTIHLEIWTLYYFLKSYGLAGFHSFLNALTNDWTTWPTIQVENAFPSSTFWDVVLYGIALLDSYGPFFRLLNNAL
ncbi:MAG: hypothetical protein ACTSRS_07050 [Candidatus Helarchaeota archaeon]